MSLKKGVFYTLLTQAPTLVLFFVASTLMTRLLGDEGRGAYILLTNQIVLFTVLLWFNLGTGITYFTSRSNELGTSITHIVATLFLLQVAIVPLIMLGLYLIEPLQDIFMPEQATHWAYYAYVGSNIILSLYHSAVSAVLLGLKHFKALNIMTILNAALSATGFLILFMINGDTASLNMLPDILIVSMSILFIVSVIWTVYYSVLVGTMPRPVFNWSFLRPVFLFSLIGYGSIVINLINYRFDVWVVAEYHGVAALGLYGVAVGLGQLLFNIPEPFSKVVVPFIYGDDTDEMLQRYKSLARLNFTIVLVLAVLLAAVGHWIVPMLFGNVFSASLPALYLLLPGILFSSATKMMAQLVIQRKMQHFNLYATIVGAVVTIALDLLLIPRWGIEGAAIATSLAYLSILVVVTFTIRSKIGIPVHDMFLIRANDLRDLTRSIPWRVLK